MTQSDGYGPGQDRDRDQDYPGDGQYGHGQPVPGQPGAGQPGRWHGAEPMPYPGGGYPASPYPPGPYPSGSFPSGTYGQQRQVPNAAMRAASTDRERTVDVLKAALAEGRLSLDEFNDRVERAYKARTYGDLIGLTADLPAGPLPVPSQPGWQPAPAPAKTNSMAVAAMVLGIAEFGTAGLTAIPAIICGHIARREIRQTGEQGGGMATAGLVLGYSALVLGVIMIVGLIAFAATGGSHPIVITPGG